MGAWGHGPFENDDAADWVWELEESDDFSLVESVLKSVVNREDYLEAPTCSEAIAAAEIVAAALGRPLDALPEEAVAWTEAHRDVPEDLADLAKRALVAIATESELRDLWAESETPDDWQQTLRDLDTRLAG